MSARDGGPAFPALNYIVPRDLAAQNVARLGETQGMTLRDYFAAKAMAGMVADDPSFQDIDITDDFLRLTAKDAYRIADAMLAARGES